MRHLDLFLSFDLFFVRSIYLFWSFERRNIANSYVVLLQRIVTFTLP